MEEEQLFCPGAPDEPGEPVGRPGRDDAVGDLREVEHGRLVGDAQIGPQRHLEAAADAVAGDGGDRRLREPGEQLVHTAGSLEVVEKGGGVEAREVVEVGPGREGPAGAREDDAAAVPRIASL